MNVEPALQASEIESAAADPFDGVGFAVDIAVPHRLPNAVDTEGLTGDSLWQLFQSDDAAAAPLGGMLEETDDARPHEFPRIAPS